MIKTCQKCGHVNPAAMGDDLEACPECGAIYSRVAAAMAGTGKATPALEADLRDSRFAARPAGAITGSNDDTHAFAESMRKLSLYPTFRGLVRLIYLAWMLLAVLAALGGVTALFMGSGSTKLGGLVGGVFLTLFFAVIAKATSEMALMLADLSDAAVQIAARMKS
jgi:hypothetical protein